MKGRIVATPTWISWKNLHHNSAVLQYPGVFFTEIYDLLADLMCIMFIQVLEMHVILPVWLTDVVSIGKCPDASIIFQQSLQ